MKNTGLSLMHETTGYMPDNGIGSDQTVNYGSNKLLLLRNDACIKIADRELARAKLAAVANESDTAIHKKKLYREFALKTRKAESSKIRLAAAERRLRRCILWSTDN